jgi:uncharacterized protein (UPF0335 family)
MAKNPEVDGGDNSKTVAVNQLRAIVERIERLAEEKAALSEDIAGVYAEAKGIGFDTRAIRSVVKLRKKDAAQRAEEQAVLDLYGVALGLW